MLPGDAPAVRIAGQRLLADAQRALVVSERLDALAIDGAGCSMAALREAVRRSQAGLREHAATQAHRAEALGAYAERLDHAQSLARRAQWQREAAIQAAQSGEADRAQTLRIEAAAEERAAEQERDEAAVRAIAMLGDAAHGWLGRTRLGIDHAIDALRDAAGQWSGRVEQTLQRLIAPTTITLVSAAIWESLLAIGATLLGVGLVVTATGAPGWLLVVAVGSLLSAFIHSSIRSDTTAATPAVRPMRPAGGHPARRSATTIGGALAETVEVDALGGSRQTVVKITEILGDDGITRWRVVLPSTQDWRTGHGDAGAVNDLDANLAIVLAPAERTQYERAVLEAMRQAGIGPDDPVLLVGFSQGGILAGHLAAHRDDYAWAGVIAAGAPIGAMSIAAGVPVVQLEHLGDPVTRLERDLGLHELLGQQPDRLRILAVAAASASGLAGIHSAVQYDATLRRHTGAVIHHAPRLNGFFAGAARSRSRYYTWHE